MADFTDNAFRAAIHALTEIVAPAVDQTNPLAVEQLQLVISWLDFQRQRTPFAHDRHRAELRLHLDMAEAVAAASGGAADALHDLLAEGRARLRDPAAGQPELQATGRDIATVIADLVDRRGPEAQTIEAAVIRTTEPLLQLQRTWFQPLGIEAGSDALPHLHDILDVPPVEERGGRS